MLSSLKIGSVRSSKFDLFMTLMISFCKMTRWQQLVLYVDAQTILQ